MIIEPKDATSCSFIKLDGIVRDLEGYALSHNSSQLQALNNAIGKDLYLLVAGTECRAKPFGVPVKIKIHNKECYVVDARQVTAISAMNAYKVTNQPDFDLLGWIGLMTAIWDSEDKSLVANLATDLSPIYATWISSTVSAAFNLDVDQRTEVSIVAAYFYWSLLGIEESVDKISSRIAKDMKLDFNKVIDVVENAGEVKDLAGLVTALKSTSGGVRLDKLDIAALYQVSTGAWMGANGRSIMEIAIEYPPYIVALTYKALTEKGYRRSRFFEYVSLFDRRSEINNLPNSLEYLKKSW